MKRREYHYGAMGRLTAVTCRPTLAPDRMYGYQDFQCFLTSGNGPWGNQSWTYDRIGNRKTENESSAPAMANYSYILNLSGKDTPRLLTVSPPPNRALGLRTYGFDAAGNQTTITDSLNELFGTDTFAYSEESKLKKLSLSYGPAESTILYDGRGFLRKAELTYTTPGSTEVQRAEPTYSSNGLLFRRRSFKQRSSYNPESGMSLSVPPVDKAAYIFYFAGRPVAQYNTFVGGVPAFLYLTTDHLGTPVIATDASGTQVWPSWKPPNSPTAGGLEPFGGMFAFAEGTEMFLRFPGQWEDGAWKTSARTASEYDNVNRWYDSNAGAFTASDPLLDTYRRVLLGRPYRRIMPSELFGSLAAAAEINHYSYAIQAPTLLFDPYGLAAQRPGCDCVNKEFENSWTIDCCLCHDACYFQRGCTALGTWPGTIYKIGTHVSPFAPDVPYGPCDECNVWIANCFLSDQGGQLREMASPGCPWNIPRNLYPPPAPGPPPPTLPPLPTDPRYWRGPGA